VRCNETKAANNKNPLSKMRLV